MPETSELLVTAAITKLNYSIGAVAKQIDAVGSKV
jgi:hypothetical protein